MLGSVATTAVGSLAGYMAGNAIMNAFSGDKNEKGEGQAQIASNEVNTDFCSSQFQSFNKCLEYNPTSISQCQWAYDLFSQCKTQSRSEKYM